MSVFGTYLLGLAALAVAVAVLWIVSLVLRNASIIDPLWSVLFLIAVLVYSTRIDWGPRTWLIVVLVAVWSLRLAGYLTIRAWGEEEDYRYQAMRRKQGPRFPLKSLVTVFLLQAVLAWLVSAPLLVAVNPAPGLTILDWLGALLWVVGIAFEAGGDFQLARFKADPANKGKVLDQGFWRLTRHPNYFGDFTLWWGYYLIAVAAGGWWTIFGPLLMSFLLLRVSGVAMLERTISKRRPGYEEYIASTNAFFPGPKRRPR